jgi:hypothetical protein
MFSNQMNFLTIQYNKLYVKNNILLPFTIIQSNINWERLSIPPCVLHQYRKPKHDNILQIQLQKVNEKTLTL